jgi:hypothetical protein
MAGSRPGAGYRVFDALDRQLTGEMLTLAESLTTFVV